MRFVERFDHFVLPVDDVVAAEDFYRDVFGCEIAVSPSGKPMRIGLNVKTWKGGMRPHTFFDVAGRRIGVYLQTDERAPGAAATRGAPTCSFLTDETGLAAVEAALAARGTRYEDAGPEEAGPAARSLYFADPAGNHFHVYVPRGVAARSGDGRLNGIGYVRLEAPDLERSTRFYGELFGLEVLDRRRNESLGAREAVLPLPGGQSVVLTELPFAAKGVALTRLEPGPHLAFYVAPDRWEPFLANLAARGVGHGDRGAELKDRRGQERDTYIDDPAGYVLQLVSDAE